MPIKKLWGREKKSEREENKTVRKQWPLHRVTEWCLSLRLGRALFSDRRFCGLPSSHSTHRLKGFASGWHNECVCVCVCMHACLCMCKCTLEGPCCVEPESECDSLRGRRGRGFVQAHARGCVRVWRHVCSLCGCDGIVPDARCPRKTVSQFRSGPLSQVVKEGEKDTHTHKTHAQTDTHWAAFCVSVKHGNRLYMNLALWSFQTYDHWWGTGSKPVSIYTLTCTHPYTKYNYTHTPKLS